ncbi:MAG TPA: hypothetical protein VGD78_02485 [Chthoniobacterales bacterium]
MSARHLTIYLKDHLAGSVAALELLDHLSSTYTGTPLASFCAGLRLEVEQDQTTLKGLLQNMGAAENPLRNSMGWVGEKLARVKVRLEDPAGGPLARLEQLDTLALGIEGKKALWRALAAAAVPVPTVDLARLEARAGDQRERVEIHRLQAAREALGPEK